MAQATYYSDNPTLSLATAIYTTAALTTKAPDGYYSDQTISRRQLTVNGITTLLAPEACANCSGTVVTLTFEEFRVDKTTGGQGNIFSFTLSDGTVPTLLTINNISVITYTDIDCTTGAVTTSASGLEIIPNVSGGIVSFTPAINCSVRPRYKRVNGFTLNGTPVVHGQTVAISGVNILINIPNNCEVLSCTQDTDTGTGTGTGAGDKI